MTLSARTSQERQVTGAPVSSTAARASSAASDSGAQMRTTPARSAVATFWPPGEKAAATIGASCPCSSSRCRTRSWRPSSSGPARGSRLTAASPARPCGLSAATGECAGGAPGVPPEALGELCEACGGAPLGVLHPEVESGGKSWRFVLSKTPQNSACSRCLSSGYLTYNWQPASVVQVNIA